MKKTTKCEKCKEAPATVYFASISEKGKTTRKKYCKSCASEEREGLLPKFIKPPETNSSGSVMDMVKNEMTNPSKSVLKESPEHMVKRLEKEMNKAVSQEDYEKAAKIRDQIAEIKKPKT